MILREHFRHHDRMKAYAFEPFLMLGNQENDYGYDFGMPYTTLDPDRGNLAWDLNTKIPEEWIQSMNTLYNLGTVEHCWNVHQACSNCALFLKVEGTLLWHSPCGGYENHGLHVTDWRIINTFFGINGFKVLEYWFSKQTGEICEPPVRGGGNTIFWMVAQKKSHVTKFTCPQQVFKNGVPI